MVRIFGTIIASRLGISRVCEHLNGNALMRHDESMLIGTAYRRKSYVVIAVVVLSCFGSLAQTKETPDPAFVLHRMYVAMGGQHWREMPGAEIKGSYDMGGLKGSFHQVIDFQNGRDVLTYDVGTTRGQQGTEQGKSWWTDEKGLATVQQAPEALADAATQSFEDRNGWFNLPPTSRPIYVGSAQENGESFHQIQVQPPGGRALTLWIDTDTYRLAKIVWFDARQRKNTIYLSDYRAVNGIWYPFSQRSSNGNASSDIAMTVSSFHLDSGLTDHDFAPPATKVSDARILTGRVSKIPFTIKDGMVVVDISVDGKPPVPFILDSGAFNALTPEAAKSLQVSMEGNLSANGVGNGQVSAHLARIGNYRIGSAELTDQRFVIISLPRSFTDNGSGTPIAGLIGYEVLRRFIVQIDYHKRELTLSLPENRTQIKYGAKVPLVFDGRDCFIEARVDDVPGQFGIDTGDDGAITLFGAFYAAHPFPIETPGIKESQGGVGGDAATLLTRVDSFQIGSFTLKRPLTELHAATGGTFASALVAGNLGSQVFRNFILTFDYENRSLYLAPSPDFGYTMPYNRTGIHLDINEASDIIVTSVNESSPGDLAGVQAHDQLVTINGQPVRGRPFSEIEDTFLRPGSTPLTLGVLRNGRDMQFVVTPRELLPLLGQLHPLSTLQ
jgi:Aspartyl protease/PDZ domain